VKHKYPEEESQRSIAKITLVCIAAFVVLCTGIGLRLANLNNVASRTPDEHIYTWEAGVVLHQGSAGIRILADQFRRDPSLFNYPPPTRAGYLWLLAKTMAVSGITDERAGAYLSCAASVASLLLVALIAWCFFSPPITLFALFVFAVSPFELALARRAWQESWVEFLGLSLIWLASAITRGSRRPLWFLLFGFLGGVCITTKEIAAVVFGVSAFWVLCVLLKERHWKHVFFLAVCALLGVGVSVFWLASSLGGFRTLVEFTLTTPKFAAVSPYSLEYEGGPSYKLLQAFWVISPAVSLFSVVGLACAFRKRTTELVRDGGRQVAVWISVFSLAFLALPMVSPHRLNLRFVCVLLGPLCLLGGLGFAYVFSSTQKWIDRRAVTGLAAAVLVVIAIVDYRTFQEVFVRKNLQDLSVKMILGAGSQTPGLMEARNTSKLLPQDPQAPQSLARSQNPPDELSATARLAESQPTPENYLNLSLLYHRAGRYQDSIAAAKNALRLKPDYAEAYNNIAAAYEGMQQWDQAIAAAQQALRLKPDFQLARNNLAYSEQQKRLQHH